MAGRGTRVSWVSKDVNDRANIADLRQIIAHGNDFGSLSKWFLKQITIDPRAFFREKLVSDKNKLRRSVFRSIFVVIRHGDTGGGL